MKTSDSQPGSVLCAVSHTVAEDEWICSSLLWTFFRLCQCVYPCSSLSNPWCYTCKLLVYGRIFSCLLWTFPVIHIWEFVSHSSIFTVVDVPCAVSYTIAEDEWIFSSLLRIFSCVLWIGMILQLATLPRKFS